MRTTPGSTAVTVAPVTSSSPTSRAASATASLALAPKMASGASSGVTSVAETSSSESERARSAVISASS